MLEVIVGQTPLDVLRAAEVRLDSPAELCEPHDLALGQHWLVPPLCAGNDASVTNLVLLGVHKARARGLRRAQGWPPRGDFAVARDGVCGEQNASRLRRHHLLDDDRHGNRALIDAVAQAVGDGALGEQRRTSNA